MGGGLRIAWGLAVPVCAALACGSRSDLGVIDLQPHGPEPVSVVPPVDATSDVEVDVGDRRETSMEVEASAGPDVEAEPEAESSRDADAAEAAAVRTEPLRVVFFGTRGSYDESALISFLQSYPATVSRLATNSSPVTGSLLTAYDVVILDQLSRSFDSSEADALRGWVHGGGAVLSLTGFVNDSQDAALPNSLLAGFPLSFASAFVALTPAPVSVSSFARSPVTVGLNNVPFWGGHQVTISGSCDGATQAIAFEEGGAVGAICQHGAGRLYLWGDEWVEFSSQWTTATDAQLFWQDAIAWLAAPSGAPAHPG
jgi:hypothetical protein